MVDDEFGLRLGGCSVARVDAAAAFLGMRGVGTSMPREMLLAFLAPMFISEQVHVQ